MPALALTKAFRVQLDFENADVEWKEVYYYGGSGITVDNFEGDLAVLCGLRKGFLAYNCTFVAASYVGLGIEAGFDLLPGTMRDVEKGHLTEDVFSGPGPLQEQNFAQRDMSVLVSLTADTGVYRRSLQVRGVPYSSWAYDPSNQFAPPIPVGLGNQMSEYLGFLGNVGQPSIGPPVGNWCIRASEKDEVANPSVQIDDVHTVSNIDQHWQLLLDVDPGWTPGTLIHVHNVKGQGTKGLNGDHHVLANVGGLVTLHKEKIDTCEIDYELAGSARERLYRLYAISGVAVERFGIRKTGGDRDAGRGRSRNNPNFIPQ